MHSSQQLPHHQHRSSGHHQQHSGPHSQQRRERGNRLDPEDARGYISQPITQHRSPSHNAMHSHSSPKRSSRYPQHTHGEAFQSSSHLYQKRRRSDEESPDQRRVADPNSEKRRMSAESALAHPHDHDPQRHRSNHLQSHQPRSKAHSTASDFVETSSSSEYLEASSSQQWEDPTVVNPADLTITLADEEGAKSRSTSSGSTVIESESPPREARKMGNRQDLSQEPFGDEDCKDLILSKLAPGPVSIPLSNFPHYYESPGYFGDQQQLQESYLQHSSSSSKLEQAAGHGLSSSPPKSRYGKSLTDLTGSNISLTSSSQQFLSQSAVDIQHMHDLHHYSDSPRQRGESRRKHQQRFYSQLQCMSSDSHLNKSHIPGLQMSITSALSNVTEEEDQRRQHKKGLSRASSQQAHRAVQQRTPARNSQLQQRHLKATMVVRGIQSTSPHKNR